MSGTRNPADWRARPLSDGEHFARTKVRRKPSRRSEKSDSSTAAAQVGNAGGLPCMHIKRQGSEAIVGRSRDHEGPLYTLEALCARCGVRYRWEERP